VKAVLITGRTIRQGMALESKDSELYTESTALCELDPEDMEELGAREGDTVLVRTAWGEVCVKAVRSQQAPHRGVVFMPLGPWANMVTGAETDSIGMPSYKGVEAEVALARERRVLTYPELLREAFGK